METQEVTGEETGIAAPPARPALARLGWVYDEMRAEAAVLTSEALAACRAAVREVTVDESVMAYILARMLARMPVPR